MVSTLRLQHTNATILTLPLTGTLVHPKHGGRVGSDKAARGLGLSRSIVGYDWDWQRVPRLWVGTGYGRSCAGWYRTPLYHLLGWHRGLRAAVFVPLGTGLL